MMRPSSSTTLTRLGVAASENSVGIGGAYLCVYGMEGPGGYQFVGLQVDIVSTVGTSSANPLTIVFTVDGSAIAQANVLPDPGTVDIAREAWNLGHGVARHEDGRYGRQQERSPAREASREAARYGND